MSFSPVMILAGLFLIGCGLVVLLAGTFMWWTREINNSMEGEVSERSSAWEFGRVLRGIVLTGFGFVLCIA